MDDLLEIERSKQGLELAGTELNKSNEEFMTVQKDYRKNLWLIFEKMGFYSAGIISLSITFIGFIVSINKTIFLTELFSKMPIYYLLFSSWGLLTLNLLLAFAYKWIDGRYMYYVSKLDLVDKRNKYDRAQLQYIGLDPNVVFPENITKTVYSNKLENQINQFKEIINSTGLEKNKHHVLSNIVQYIITASFVLGVILLLIFVTASIMILIKT